MKNQKIDKQNSWEKEFENWMLEHYKSTNRDAVGKLTEFYIEDLYDFIRQLIKSENQKWEREIYKEMKDIAESSSKPMTDTLKHLYRKSH